MNAVSPTLRAFEDQSRKLVVWVFRTGNDQWFVRREGDVTERHFAHRRDAVDFAHCLAEASGGYKLFVQLPTGGFLTECRGYYA